VHAARQKLQSFKQKGSASSYADQFTTLALTAKLGEGEKQFHFIEGLKLKVKERFSIEYELGKLLSFKRW
jgi:Retrotransposon gag protein